MLIGSGWAKGLKLKAPEGEATRPTAARVRGAILNMLAPELEGAMFLDLFAGSGAMGIEAVSRGARGAVFVEQAREALACLKANVTELNRRATVQKLPPLALTVLGKDVGRALGELPGLGPFDIIFADPPYRDARQWIGQLLPVLAPVTAADGLLVVETAAAEADAFGVDAEGADTPGVGGWDVLKQRAYGDTMVSMLRRRGGESGGD